MTHSTLWFSLVLALATLSCSYGYDPLARNNSPDSGGSVDAGTGDHDTGSVPDGDGGGRLDGGMDAEADVPVECRRAGDCDDGVDCTVDSCGNDNRCRHRRDDSLCVIPGESCDVSVGCGRSRWVDGTCEDRGDCGAGTAEAPFATISEALDAVLAPTETTRNFVHVRPGHYEESYGSLNSQGQKVVILGEPGVVWTQPGKVGLTVLGNAEIEIRNLVMTDMARAIECGGFARCDLAEVEIGAMADEAAQVRGSASLHVDRSFISGSARNGIRVRDLSRLTVVNSIVTGNGLADDARGGAIVVDSQEAGVSVINSTLADNGAGDFAGGIHTVAEANVSVVNTIFWNNSDVPSECHECTLGDDSLLGMDPRFVVADGQRARAEDYRIRARSPARGGGTAGDGVPDIDYWGQLRDSTVDTGAHEFVP